ncbi:MAG: UDP-N-acetylmuramoyl-L-alanyl-D-glutamate--2,6-diaminopimelate ligase [Planctomycetota bacterium]
MRAFEAQALDSISWGSIPWGAVLHMKTLGRPLALKELHQLVEGARIVGGADTTCISLSCDTRTLRPGALFFAVPGYAEDGLAYAAQAVERGAVGIVAEREMPTPLGAPVLIVPDVRIAKARAAAAFYDHPSRALDVIGVTGTNGKTSTTFMLRSILEHDGRLVGLLGTVGYDCGRGLQRSSNTTPDAIDLQRDLAEMVDRGLEAAVMEVSSHALAQHRVTDLQFRAGVFTNLSSEHLDYHKTMEAYRDAKARLFEQLDSGAVAVLNADDPTSPYLRERCRCRVLTYGLLPGCAEVTARLKRMDIDGMAFDLVSPWGTVDVISRFVGQHNLCNALAACATALELGASLQAIKGAFEVLTTIPGRLEPVDRGQDFRVLVDYAHTDDALGKVLDALRPLTRGRLIVLLGCGGDRDRGKRPRMGAVASRLADVCIVTSDNPRSEEPGRIIEEIMAGVTGTAESRVVPDRRQAIRVALELARGGDIVLLAGKGHEDYQILGRERIPFDDRKVAEEVLWSL